MSKKKTESAPIIFDPRRKAREEKEKSDYIVAKHQATTEGETIGQTLLSQMVFATLQFWIEKAEFTQKDRMGLVSDLMDQALSTLPSLDSFPAGFPTAALADLREQTENDYRAWLVTNLGEKNAEA